MKKHILTASRASGALIATSLLISASGCDRDQQIVGPESMPSRPALVAASPTSGAKVLVANTNSGSVVAYWAATDRFMTEVPVGASPYGISVTPDQATAWVANFAENRIAVIDLASMVVTKWFSSGGAGPTEIAFAPDGGLAYVTNYNSSSLVAINTVTNATVTTKTLPFKPHDVTLTPDGQFVYVSARFGHHVSVYRASNLEFVRDINVGTEPIDIAFTPNGERAFVTSFNSSSVSAIDVATGAVSFIAVGGATHGITISPDGRIAYAASHTTGKVILINTETLAVISTTLVGNDPAYLAATPDGAGVYVGINGKQVIHVLGANGVPQTPILFGPGRFTRGIAVADADPDGDGINITIDNCKRVANADQQDTDADGIGDACDSDSASDGDQDGISDVSDNCIDVANPDQADTDSDGPGDLCDAFPRDPDNDVDGDGIGGDVDNAPTDYNPDQADRDSDGVADVIDACPNDPRNDEDHDGVCGDVDNAPTIPNPDQADADSDGIADVGDACRLDPHNDEDRDGVCGDVDNAPTVANPDQADRDRDGVGDVADNCREIANADQRDQDRDGVGDACENRGPVASAGGPYAGAEGSIVSLTAAGSSDPDGDALTYAWDLDNNGTFGDATDALLDQSGNRAVRVTAARQYTDNSAPSAFKVSVKVSDPSLTSVASADITVDNVKPTVTAIGLPPNPIAINTTVSATASFTDPGSADTHTAHFTWDWDLAKGAAIFGAATTTLNATAGSVISSTRYARAGVYTVHVAVSDDDGASGERASSLDFPAYVVVYDPSGGFVTGGGWILSASGDCTLNASCATASGKASFGFVSKYQKGAQVPTGDTDFEFKAGNFRFVSTNYQWMVVAGARAQYKGEGVVNGGVEAYGFLLTSVDGALSGGGGIDRFRLKVWNKATGVVVYDNQRDQPDDSDATSPLGGGSIVIHQK